jgi:H+/Cl- antiporter ClcA
VLAWLPWRTLPGLLVGIMAGFMSPWLMKGALTFGGIWFRWWRKRMGDAQDATTLGVKQ